MNRHNLTLDGRHYIEQIVDQEGNTVGYAETHPNKLEPNKECSGSIRLEGAKWSSGASWTQEGLWPNITLKPSVLCSICGMHGYIINGAWVDC